VNFVDFATQRNGGRGREKDLYPEKIPISSKKLDYTIDNGKISPPVAKNLLPRDELHAALLATKNDHQ
jgi:hypothetical protein